MRRFLILSLLLWNGSAYGLPHPAHLPEAHLYSPAPTSGRELDRDTWIEVNDLGMAVTNHGSFGYNIIEGVGGLIYPVGTENNAMFAAGIWAAGYVHGELRAAIAEYNWEFTPGVIFPDGTWPDLEDPHYRVYEITADSGPGDPDYDEWPVHEGAPVDENGAPLLIGAQTLYSTYHDADPWRHENDAGFTSPLGLEVHHLAYAFDLPTPPLARVIIHEFEIENKGEEAIYDAVFSIWSDVDLGGGGDDVAGSIPDLQTVFTYNALAVDHVYGSRPPATAISLLGGSWFGTDLGSSIIYTNGEDPSPVTETYYYMRGLKPDGTPMIDPTTGEPSRFWFNGYPGDFDTWIDRNPGDRRMMVSTPPSQLDKGERIHLRSAVLVGQGANYIASARVLYPQIAALHRLEAKGAFPIPTRWAVAGAFQDTSQAVASVCVLAPEDGSARVSVLNASGQFVREVLAQQFLERGIATVEWDGLDEHGVPVAGGDYIFELRVNESADPELGVITDRERFAYLPVSQRTFLVDVPKRTTDSKNSDVGPDTRHGKTRSGPGILSPNETAVILQSRLVPGGARIELVHSATSTVPGMVRIIAPSGRIVRTLHGRTEFEWDGQDSNGRPAPSSVYLLRYESETGTAVGRLVWVR